MRCTGIYTVFLILYLYHITGYFCVERYSDEESLRKCETFVESQPKSENLNLYYWENHGDMGNFRKKVGKFELHNYIKFHQISAVAEDNDVTKVCVSMEDTTSYTYALNKIDDGPVAWATFNTRIEVPTSIISVSTPCWRRYKKLGECNPTFMPMPGYMDSALFNYSPLNEEFWNHVQDDTIYNKNWIWRMNFQTNVGNINSSWVSHLNITSMTELQFLGNDWRRPDALIGSLPRLQKLDLSHNNLEILPNDTLERMSELSTIILGHNNISKLPYGVEKLDKIKVMDLTNPTGNATLSLSDDEISTLSKVQTLGLERTKLVANVSKILGLPNVTFLNLSGCFLGQIEDDYVQEFTINSKLVVLDLSFNNMSEFPTRIFSHLVNLNFLYLHDNLFQNCTNNSLNSLISLKELDLSRNGFTSLTSDCFSKLYNLEKLDLSWNQLTVISPFTFNNSTKLTNLQLSHNRISVITSEIFSPLIKLNKLDLSYNHLTQMPSLNSEKLDELFLTHNHLTRYINTSSTPKYIKLLDLSENQIQELNFQNVAELNLSYNSLTHIPTEMWQYFRMPTLTKLDLGGNIFNCCHNNTKLLQHMVNNSQNIQNLYKGKAFTCSIGNDQEVLLDTFQYNSTICLETEYSSKNVYIEIGVAIFFLVALVAVTSTLLYFYRTELTYISHLFKMKKRGWERDEERYSVCHYDAFVCYSGKDFKWIMEELIPNLENNLAGYRLCLHDRDFTLGAAIDTNVVASLEKSRKVIFVLTQDFIGSRWCQWELEMANHKMFEENRGYIILIELERLDKKNMPRHLRYLMDTRTYLEWPQDRTDEQKVVRCWKRLRNALGDSILKRTGRGAPRCSVLDL